uniref:Transmembrane protein n=1 Tax=Panagrellus redivivus TaxID=6233 RepID=A0A7E4VGN9_PANRE
MIAIVARRLITALRAVVVAFRCSCCTSSKSCRWIRTHLPIAMAKFFPFCGPALSAFCMIMSVWGVIFLGLLGVFFHAQAVTLFPDLALDHHANLDVATVEETYAKKATQCWIAAGLYLGTFVVIFIQNRFNPPLL